MAIKPKFSFTDIERATQNELRKIENGVLTIMQRVGEQFVTDARNAVNIQGSAFSKGDYTDQTANLRSSIGYFIIKDDQVVKENLSGNWSGRSAAKKAIRQAGYKPGYRIIGTAGMEYASYLESKGYNVISSQQMNLIIDLSDKLKKFSRGKMDFEQSFTGPASTLNL